MEKKYKSLSEFKKDYPKEYKFLCGKKLLAKLCEDMNWEYVEKNSEIKVLLNLGLCFDEYLEYKRTTKN
jgi:hypothetical protein